MREILLAAALALTAVTATAQNYPSRPVRVIVPYAPGGNTDITARAISTRLTEAVGQQFVVENRPGGATNIGSDLVAKAVPDGYTLLMGGASNAINMSLIPKMPYDTERDFAPIILCVQGANVLSVHPSLPARTLKDIIALAKAKPGQLNFATSGIGSSNQMAGELLKMTAGINLVHVPYKGVAPALTDALGGHVEILITGVPALVPHVQAGRMRAIAISSAKRFPALPSVPTFIESGLPGFEVYTWFGLMAPVKVPREVITRINAEVNKILTNPELRERFLSDGLETMGGTPQDFAKYIRIEIEKYTKVVRAGKLKGE